VVSYVPSYYVAGLDGTWSTNTTTSSSTLVWPERLNFTVTSATDARNFRQGWIDTREWGNWTISYGERVPLTTRPEVHVEPYTEAELREQRRQDQIRAAKQRLASA
jgi:hypothetical protein